MNAFGNRIADGMMQGYRLYQHSSSKREEVTQERPGPATWKIWKKILDKAFMHRKW